MLDTEEKYTLENAVARCQQRKGTPLAVAQFSHPGDSFLFIVLIEFDEHYVVWTLNLQTGEFFFGHYFPFLMETKREALSDAYTRFQERMLAVSPLGRLGGVIA